MNDHDSPQPALARGQRTRQTRALADLIDAYQAYGRGSTFRLLRDLGDHLALSLAYVDRDTVEAHLERALSDIEWAATNDQFTALDFDEHIGDQNTVRTDWIETVLEKAGVPGSDYTTDDATDDARTSARGEDAVTDEDVRA
jgi:hypothetical protein